jgi:hypothetical protein
VIVPVPPQSEQHFSGFGVGAGSGGASIARDARAAETAAAARGDSRSMAAGSADSQTRTEMIHSTSFIGYHPLA